jgi:hypothetical protein
MHVYAVVMWQFAPRFRGLVNDDTESVQCD